MTFDELTTFITLAQSKSFSRTAELLFTSQSTISFRIRSIESQVGRPLFDRSTRHIELTPAGKDFLFYALQLDSLYREGLQAAALDSFNYKVSIGAPDSFWQSILLPALSEYFLSNKDVSFELVSDHSSTLNQLLLEEKLDIGISFIPFRHTNLEYIPLATSPYVLVAHKDLPLRSRKLTLQNAGDFPLIYCRWSSPFDTWFREIYSVCSHFVELDRTWLFLEMLRNRLGVGFMPLRMARQLIEDGEFVRLDYEYAESAPSEENYIMYNRKHEERILPIVDVIQAYVKGTV